MFISFRFEKILIYCFFFILIHLFCKRLEQSNKISKKNYRNLKVYGQISQIITFFLEKKFANVLLNKNDLNYFNFKEFLFPSQKIICLIIFCIIYDFLACFLNVNHSLREYNYYGDILIVFFIEIILFKNSIYKHHLLSMIIFIILIIYIFLSHFTLIKLALFLPKFLLNCHCFYFSIFIIKFLNTKYFISTFLCGSFIGVQRLIYQRIKKKYTFAFDLNFSNKNFLILNLLYYIVRFIYYYLYYYIIAYYPPVYIFINENILSVINKFIDKSTNNKQGKSSNLIELIILNIISIISCFIFTEILQLNFCDLNKNIRSKIKERALIEENLTEISKDSKNEINNYSSDSFNDKFY